MALKQKSNSDSDKPWTQLDITLKTVGESLPPKWLLKAPTGRFSSRSKRLSWTIPQTTPRGNSPYHCRTNLLPRSSIPPPPVPDKKDPHTMACLFAQEYLHHHQLQKSPPVSEGPQATPNFQDKHQVPFFNFKIKKVAEYHQSTISGRCSIRYILNFIKMVLGFLGTGSSIDIF